MRDPLCDCSGDGPVCDPNCISWSAPYATDLAEQAAAEDGYPSLRSAIRHPSHAATRAHFKANPFPRQTRGTAA